MRLINAEDIKKRSYCYPQSVRSVIANILSHTKTVKDVVEVVRCKDCKYYNRKYHYCDVMGYWFGEEDAWNDNGFCYKGEREKQHL